MMAVKMSMMLLELVICVRSVKPLALASVAGDLVSVAGALDGDAETFNIRIRVLRTGNNNLQPLVVVLSYIKTSLRGSEGVIEVRQINSGHVLEVLLHLVRKFLWIHAVRKFVGFDALLDLLTEGLADSLVELGVEYDVLVEAGGKIVHRIPRCEVQILGHSLQTLAGVVNKLLTVL